MAKNLKLNIKNTQLAEALQLGKVKKAPPKKKAEEVPLAPAVEPPPQVEVAAPPVETPVETRTFDTKSKAIEEPPSAALPEEAKKNPPIAEKREAPTQPTRPSQFTPITTRPFEPRPAVRHSPQPYRPQSRPPYRPPYSRPSTGGNFSSSPRPYGPNQPGAGPAPRRDFRTPSALPLPRRGAPGPGVEIPTKPKREVGPESEKGRKAPIFKDFRDVKPQKRADTRSFDSRDRQGLRSADDEGWRKRRPSQKARMIEMEEAVVRPKELSIRIPISIKDLASAMKLKASQLLAKLLMQGVVLTLNDFLDDETVIQLLGHEFDCTIAIDRSEEERIRITDKTIKQEIQESADAALILRPPVVTFMGHVDHGKTSLIDKIRSTNIAAGEAGAITQHIGAFKCHTAVGDLTILDTPGHEAFSAMRERGADVTDIVVLVIAGDEGMRAQTVEAIDQAQKAAVPIVVALNKSDKPNFDAENIYRQLADKELLPEAWGGTTITVNCSATSGAGVKELLEMLALQAEILELKANPHARARGTVIESEMHKGLGLVATLLVQNGTLRIGDALVFDQHWARVKTMHDEHGQEMNEAGPSTPVKITGLSGLPEAGSEFIAVKNEVEARDLSYERTLGVKHASFQKTKRASLDTLMQQTGAKQEKKTLNLILRADVQGSLDALKNSIFKIESKKVDINILSAGVGEISESDIQLAHASKAPIIGFHTQIESHADQLIKQTKVIVKTHDVIYHAIDDIKSLMLDLLDKIAQENDVGTAEVLNTFKASQLGIIAGCKVIDGVIRRNCHMRVVRNDQVIWKGSIASLKRVKEDAREVNKGFECGILLQNFNDVKVGDILQAYEITYLQQEL